MLAFRCLAEAGMEDVFFDGLLVELGVRCHDFGFLSGGEPISFAARQAGFQLGIDLIVHDTFAVDQMFCFNADESPATGGIGEQVKTVACTDERSDARQVAEILLISFADIQVCHLHQILQ